MKNFRIEFKIDEDLHQIDFSMDGKINSETKAISAKDEIKKNILKLKMIDLRLLIFMR